MEYFLIFTQFLFVIFLAGVLVRLYSSENELDLQEITAIITLIIATLRKNVDSKTLIEQKKEIYEKIFSYIDTEYLKRRLKLTDDGVKIFIATLIDNVIER